MYNKQKSGAALTLPTSTTTYLDGGSKNNCCLPSRQDSNPHAYGFLKVTKIQNIFFIRQKKSVTNFDLSV